MNEFDLIRALCRRPGTDATTGLAKARAVLTDHIAGGRRLGGRRPIRHPARRRVYLASGVAAVAAVAAVSLSVLPGRTAGVNQPGHGPAAPASFDSLAAAAAAWDPALGPDQYRYIRVDGYFGPAFALTASRGRTIEETTMSVDYGGSVFSGTNELWLSGGEDPEWLLKNNGENVADPDLGSNAGSWCYDKDQGESRPRGAGYREVPNPMLRNYGQGTTARDCDIPGDWMHPTPEFVASLPADPGGLVEYLREDAHHMDPHPNGPGLHWPPDVFAFGWLATLVAAPTAPPEARSLAYQAIALIPGISIADSDHGTAVVSLADENLIRYDMEVDSDTGLVRGLRSEVLDAPPGSNLRSGTVVETTITTAVVDGLGTRPADSPPLQSPNPAPHGG